MIYRVHYPHDNDGNIGKAIGYITICPAVSSLTPIYTALNKAGFLTIAWEDTLISAHASNVPNAIEYEVKRRRPIRERLLYLVPLQPEKAAAKLTSSGGDISGTFGTTTNTIGRLYEVVGHIQAQPAINIAVNVDGGVQWRVAQQPVAPIAQNEAPPPPQQPARFNGFTVRPEWYAPTRRNNQ